MFKLPNKIPTLRSSFQEWADYSEYAALKKGSVSLLSIVKAALLVRDEITVEGIEDDTDKFINKADEITSEIKKRKTITRNQYPFELDNKGYTLKYIPSESNYNLVYRFLLLSTRLKMSEEKIQSNLDGTLLFEKLCAKIALAFFGDNANVDILGTSRSDIRGFRDKLKDVVSKIGEGGVIHQHLNFQPQDDKIDVIVWKGFADKNSSQMLAFGQCKTGTSWQDQLSELNTEVFCKTWFSTQPILTPVKLFFCAQYFPIEIWAPRAYQAGLVFDRFRIMDYLPQNVDDDLLNSLRSWCIAAESRFN